LRTEQLLLEDGIPLDTGTSPTGHVGLNAVNSRLTTTHL